MTFKESMKLLRHIRDREFTSVRRIIEKWPMAQTEELLKLISCSMMSLHEKTSEDDMSFSTEVSKAIMLAVCESQDYESMWNCGINDEVPLHFDEYRSFLCACTNGNLQMIKDFCRFQYDEEDGSNIIPDHIWIQGIELANKGSYSDVSTWIRNYLEKGTDDEEDSVMDEDDDLEDEEDDEDEEEKIYQENRKRLKLQKIKTREETSSLSERLKSL